VTTNVPARPRTILRRKALKQKIGLGPSRTDELEREGKFPQRVRLSERAVGWYEDEVDAWLESRPRASDMRPDLAGDPRRRGVGAKKKTPIPTSDAS
jgi:prophage regulatory protein